MQTHKIQELHKLHKTWEINILHCADYLFSQLAKSARTTEQNKKNALRVNTKEKSK